MIAKVEEKVGNVEMTAPAYSLLYSGSTHGKFIVVLFFITHVNLETLYFD